MLTVNSNEFVRKSLLLLFSVGSLAQAVLGPEGFAQGRTVYRFDQLWQKQQKESPSIQSKSLEVEEAALASERASRHWYPRIVGEVRAVTTNDSTLSFMSLLGQRSIDSSDFNPETLNEPGNRSFQSATLGLDFPLYEGGSKHAYSLAAGAVRASKESERDAHLLLKKGEYFKLYSTLIAHISRKDDLEDLRSQVQGVLKVYRLGDRSNPVGYSGQLGLQNLENRVIALILESTTQIEASREMLKSEWKTPEASWDPAEKSVDEVVSREFENILREPQADSSRSSAVLSLEHATGAYQHLKDAERARHLPKLGLFAQAGLLNGERNIGNQFSGGAYLQWELFNSQSWGAVEQAAMTVSVWEGRTEAAQRSVASGRLAAQKGVQAGMQSLTLVSNSAKLLREQTRIARTLFQSGSINALQLAEVFSRRADLLVNQAEIELQLSDSVAQWLATQNWNQH
jgi:hypothetical protein